MVLASRLFVKAFAYVLLWWKFFFLIVSIILFFSFRRISWFQKKLWALLQSWRKFNIAQQPALPWPYVITHSTWVIQQDIRNYLQCWSISRKLAGGKARDFFIEREKKKSLSINTSQGPFGGIFVVRFQHFSLIKLRPSYN